MKSPSSCRATLLASLSVLTLSGCAAIPRGSHEAKITPVTPQIQASGSKVDLYYAGAVRAIERRDYALALDLLQAARQSSPDDVRVINAFGVVYDKLGRFDLSRRYYAQARQLEPGSAIVRVNMAYSDVLQGLSQQPMAFASGAPLAVAVAPPPVQSMALVVQEAPGVVRLLPGAPVAIVPIQTSPAAPVNELATLSARDAAPELFALAAWSPVKTITLAQMAASSKSATKLIGAPILLVDASGSADGARRLKQRLTRLGWSIDQAQVAQSRSAEVTRIDYPARYPQVANALARTLPGTIRVRSCATGCTAIRLVVGRDSLAWLAAQPGLNRKKPARS